jgi:hypothetical protein
LNCGNAAISLSLGFQPPEKHRHSGIGMHTPASVHYGTATDIRARRQATLDRAHAQHPERFSRRPQPPCLPEHAWINQPTQQQPTQVRSTVSFDLTATAWSRVEARIATRKPAEYDAAITLLTDLQALAERDGRRHTFTQRSTALRQTHTRKPSLIERLNRAGL